MNALQLRIVTIVLLCTSSSLSFSQSPGVMTYNIRYDNPSDGINAWKERKGKLCDLIKRESPDIFCVQEALHNQMIDLEQYFSDYQGFGVGREDGKEAGEYAAVFFQSVKYERQDRGWFWLSQTPEKPGSMGWDAACTRIVTWVKLRDKTDGGTFFVFNTHFDHVGKMAQKNSAVLLKNKIKEITQGNPVIVTGDFNCNISSTAMRILQRKEKNLCLRDSRKTALMRKGPAYTYTTFFVNSRPEEVIDHILVSDHFRVDAFSILTDSEEGRYFSDHLPVKAILFRVK